MDRPEFGANTDVLVLADAERRHLLWVPRDLWCEGLGTRVNRAYAQGGHGRLAAALAEHNLAVDGSVCLLPGAIATAFDGVTVAMPVRERMEFWYPLEPLRPIEEGRKRVVFEPPVEMLAGERIHQWLGARYRIDLPGTDLDRIERQQQMVAVLLGEGFDFARFLASAADVRLSAPSALDELRAVRWDFRAGTLSGLMPEMIGGKDVLVRRGT
jgi:hypothetical protein